MAKTAISYNVFGVSEVAEGDLQEAQRSWQPHVGRCGGNQI